MPTLDSLIEQYVVEALTAFEKQMYFAAAVMLGAASEKALYLLAESVRDAFKDAKKHAKLKSLLDARGLKALFEYVRDAIRDAYKAKLLPYSDYEGSVTHLTSLFEAIRVQRNDAVHPMNATVSASQQIQCGCYFNHSRMHSARVKNCERGSLPIRRVFR